MLSCGDYFYFFSFGQSVLKMEMLRHEQDIFEKKSLFRRCQIFQSYTISLKFAGVAAFLQKRIKHCLIMDFEENSAVFLNWTFFRISAHCANAHTERFDWVNKFWISSWHLDSGNWTAQPAEHYVGRCPRGRSVLKVPIPVKFLNFF